MKQNYLHEQRGVAMLLELVLVAAVLALVGVAVYQSSQHQTASTTSTPPVNKSVSLANNAAAIGETESATDASLSASAEASIVTATDADVDVTNLGGSSGADSF
jgi:cytoskeletal protein RodZ